MIEQVVVSMQQTSGLVVISFKACELVQTYNRQVDLLSIVKRVWVYNCGLWSRSLPPSAIKTLVVSLMLSRVDYGNATLTCIPGYLLRRRQSMLNAAARPARVISGLPRLAHISTTLANLHWLRAAERIMFKLATLTYRCRQGSASYYLSADFIRVADLPSRRRPRSSSTDGLIARPSQLVTVGGRAFLVACANLWNGLPGELNFRFHSLILGATWLAACVS